MTSDTKVERLIVELRRYAEQYEDGSALGRAIEGTEDLMYEAADLLEELQELQELLSEVATMTERAFR